MIPASNRFLAVLDASVLYPLASKDLLLRFYHADLFKARWTDKIMEEWTFNLKRKRPELEEGINRTEATMRDKFDDAWIFDYEDLIDSLELPDPNDRHVLAAAIKCGAHYLVTNNIKHFPTEILEKYDMEAGTADQFLSGTVDLFPYEAFPVLRLHQQKRDLVFGEYILYLRKSQLPLLANLVNANKVFF